MTILVTLEISGGERDSINSLNTTEYSGEGAWEWVSTRGRWESDFGNVLYPGLDGGCMGVEICKIHWAVS